MKRLIFRILAFIFDLFLINIVLFAVSNISLINHHKDEMAMNSKAINEISRQYNELSGKLDKMLYDKYIDLSEAIEIKDQYDYFEQSIYDIPINSELSDEDINRFKSNLFEDYKEYVYSYNYKVNKTEIVINIIGVVISILYFGVFEWFKKGKTIGKMIFRLKTVDNTDAKKSIPLWKYLIKALLISGVVFTISNIIITLISTGTNEGSFGLEWYNTFYKRIYDVQYVYNTLFMLFIFIRRDERSIHDILLNIRVLLHDKEGKEVTSRIFNEEVNNKAN